MKENYISESLLSQCIDVEGRRDFRIAARYKAIDSDPKYKIALTWYFERGCQGVGVYDHNSGLNSLSSSDWQILKRAKIEPPEGAVSVRLSLVQNGNKNLERIAEWDDILFVSMKSGRRNLIVPKLKKLPKGKNLIVNGTFDEDISEWRRADYIKWSLTEGNSHPGSLLSTIESDEGGTGNETTVQCVTLGLNKNYQIAASVKKDPASSQAGQARLEVTWYDQPDCRGKYQRGDYASSNRENGWQRIVIGESRDPDLEQCPPRDVKGGVRPDSAKSALVRLTQWTDGSGTYSVFWDDVTFETKD